MSSNNNGSWILDAAGFETIKEVPAEQADFFRVIIDRAGELAGGSVLTKVKASHKETSVSAKAKFANAGTKPQIDWRDGVLHALRAVADMRELGLTGIRCELTEFIVSWNATREQKRKEREAANASGQ